jgi:hypothetical protein
VWHYVKCLSTERRYDECHGTYFATAVNYDRKMFIVLAPDLNDVTSRMPLMSKNMPDLHFINHLKIFYIRNFFTRPLYACGLSVDFLLLSI